MSSIGVGEGLFGTSTRTATLLLIGMLGETHSSEIAGLLDKSRSRIKAAVDSLELAGIITGAEEGTARRLTLNPRYPAAEELRSLILKLAMLDVELQRRVATIRRRPRRAGKKI